jgi:outer membrane protein assembly factor BamD
MEDYRASIVSFENVLRDFPSTAYKEESMWLMVKAAYHYASASVESKQEERYRNTLEYYRRFKENFSQSGYMKEADRIKTDCELRLKKNSMMKEVSQAEK